MKNKLHYWASAYPRTFAVLVAFLFNLLYLAVVEFFFQRQSWSVWLNQLMSNVGLFALLLVISWLWVKFKQGKK